MYPLVTITHPTPIIVASISGLADFKAKAFTPTEFVKLPEVAEFAIKLDQQHANEHFVENEIVLANEVDILQCKDIIYAAILFVENDYSVGVVSIIDDQVIFTPFNKEHPAIVVSNSSAMKLAEIIISKRECSRNAL